MVIFSKFQFYFSVATGLYTAPYQDLYKILGISNGIYFSLQKTSLKPQPPGFYASAPESNRIPQDIWGAPTPPAPAAPIQPPPGFGGKINLFSRSTIFREVRF